MQCLGALVGKLCAKLRRSPENNVENPQVGGGQNNRQNAASKSVDDNLFWLFESKRDDDDDDDDELDYEEGRSISSPLVPEEEEQGLSEEVLLCGICADDVAAYSASPCQHAACEACWRTWLAEHKNCWLCGSEVKRLRRAARRHIHSLKSAGAVEKRVAELRRALARGLRRLVAIKHAARAQLVAIDEVAAHCRDLEMGDYGGDDSSLAVLSVERLNVARSLTTLADLFVVQTEEKKNDWTLLKAALEDVKKKAGACSLALEGGGVSTDKRSLLRACEDSEHFGCDVLAAQWRAAQTTLAHCMERLPNLKPVLFSGHPLHGTFADYARDPAAFDDLIHSIEFSVVERDSEIDDALNDALTVAAKLASF